MQRDGHRLAGPEGSGAFGRGRPEEVGGLAARAAEPDENEAARRPVESRYPYPCQAPSSFAASPAAGVCVASPSLRRGPVRASPAPPASDPGS